MPRLSIVIASVSFDSQVEDTLVSVLQHRPEYSEVIVATTRPYDDPFGLRREVRFLASEVCQSRLELLNFGCSQARGDVLHVVLPGVIVLDGWTDHIWKHFVNEQVGAVAPVVMVKSTSVSAAALGVTYLPRGERRTVGAGTRLENEVMRRAAILSPTLAAGFYRRSVLVALGGFDPQFGEWLADIEFGLALRDLGQRTVVEPRSRVVQAAGDLSFAMKYSEGEQAERLYRRHCGGGLFSWSHSFVIGCELLRAFPRTRMVSSLLGRIAAHRERSVQAQYETRLEQARTELRRSREECTTIPLDSRSGLNHRRELGAIAKLRRTAA